MPVKSVRLTDEELNEVKRCAREDRRTDADEIRWLIVIGLQVRDRQIEIWRDAIDDVARQKGDRERS